MNLRKQKILAKKVLKVGKGRIIFVKPRIGEIKEIMTKQNVRELKEEGAIIIKEKKGRIKVKKTLNKRGVGNVRKKVNKRKQEYVIMTRKLRRYVAEMKSQKKITNDEAKEIRKKIRNRIFRSKAHLKEYIGGLEK